MKNKPYKIPQLPFGWYCDDMTLRLVDASTISNDDDGSSEVLFKIAFEDNGAGHYLICEFVNGKGDPINKFEIDAESLSDIAKFTEALVNMIDSGRDRAFQETEPIFNSKFNNETDPK